METRHDSRRTPGRTSRGGFALVMVLAVLVLMLAVILAFFTRATTNRMISSSSAGVLASASMAWDYSSGGTGTMRMSSNHAVPEASRRMSAR